MLLDYMTFEAQPIDRAFLLPRNSEPPSKFLKHWRGSQNSRFKTPGIHLKCSKFKYLTSCARTEPATGCCFAPSIDWLTTIQVGWFVTTRWWWWWWWWWWVGRLCPPVDGEGAGGKVVYKSVMFPFHFLSCLVWFLIPCSFGGNWNRAKIWLLQWTFTSISFSQHQAIFSWAAAAELLTLDIRCSSLFVRSIFTEVKYGGDISDNDAVAMAEKSPCALLAHPA